MVVGSPTLRTHDNWNENIKVMKVEVDQARARALGVSSQSIAESSHVILSGATIGQYRENNRLIDIVFRNPESERDTLAELMNANVPTASGSYVPLSQVGKEFLELLLERLQPYSAGKHVITRL